MTIDKTGIITELKDREIKGNFIDFASPKNSAQEYAKSFIDQFSFLWWNFLSIITKKKKETGIHIL